MKWKQTGTGTCIKKLKAPEQHSPIIGSLYVVRKLVVPHWLLPDIASQDTEVVNKRKDAPGIKRRIFICEYGLVHYIALCITMRFFNPRR